VTQIFCTCDGFSGIRGDSPGDRKRLTAFISSLPFPAPLLAFLYYFFCVLLLPLEKALILGGLMILYYIPPSGKESLIPLGIALGIPWWLIATSLVVLDVLTSLFVILNIRLALASPSSDRGSPGSLIQAKIS